MMIAVPRKTIRLARRYALPAPALRLTPNAWTKLLFLRDAGPTEIGGFGVSAATDLLLIEDVRLVKQYCSLATVKFDDASVADFFDEQVDAGLAPERFGRIWVHTHPGHSPLPSSTDEETFARCFGRADWSVMLILACGGRAYARLRFGVGPGASLILPIEIDFGAVGSAIDRAVWEQEYRQSVMVDELRALPKAEPCKGGTASRTLSGQPPAFDSDPFFDPARFDSSPFDTWESMYGLFG